MPAKKTKKTKETKKKYNAPPSPFPFNVERPLDRIPTKTGEYMGESKIAHAALVAYCRMGERRSLRGLLKRFCDESGDGSGKKPLTTSRNTIEKWSVWFAWVQRAEIYDIQESERYEREVAARRRETIERDYNQGEKMRNLADMIMKETPAFIKETETIRDGVIYVKQQIDIQALIRLVETGSKLERKATGLDKADQSIEVTVKLLDDLSDEMLNLVAAGKVSTEDLIEMSRKSTGESDA